MKVVVTGGAGFIGSHLCDKLLQKGYEVTCIDNLSTGKKENVQHLANNHHFSFVEGDISNYDVCSNAVKGADYVLHQAALGSVPRSINNPLPTHQANSTGFLNILWAAKENNIKKVVYASSSSVYGDNKDLPKTESNVGTPLSPYAVTKKTNELYAKVFSELYALPIIGLRYFNVFGERQDPNGAYAAVIPKFISALLNNEPVSIHGDGEQMRDFTYVQNVVNANLLALESNNDNILGNVFNIACGERTTLNTLVQYLKDIITELKPSNQNIEVNYSDPRKGDIKQSFASIEKATSLLNYSPEIFLKEGLEKVINSLAKS